LYGEYLQYTLAEAETNHPGTLEKINGEAVAILPDASHEKFRMALSKMQWVMRLTRHAD
jgi:hypothetical protein